MRGLVVNDLYMPLSGITILIGSSSVVTGSTGTFEIASVPARYDLVALDGTGGRVDIYRGLTRRDPILRRLGGGSSRATVSGTLSGITFPVASAKAIKIAFGSAQVGSSGGSTEIGPGDGPAYIPFEALWGAGTKSGYVCALAYQGPLTGNAAAFDGWGCTNVTVTPDTPRNGVNIALGAVQNQTVAGTATLPPGYAVSKHLLQVYRGDSPLPMRIREATTGVGTTFSYPAPGGPSDLLVGVRVEATNAAAAESAMAELVTSARTGVSLELVAAPTLGVPINEATAIVPNQTFSWGASNAGIYHVRFEAPNAARNIHVYTRETSMTLPDLSSIGAALPANTRFYWSVDAGPATSVDEAAGAIGRPARQWRTSSSRQRTFTTAP